METLDVTEMGYRKQNRAASIILLFLFYQYARCEDGSAKMMRRRFEDWKAKHKRHYTTAEEKELRFSIYMANVEKIESHNKHGSGYVLEENQFTDLSYEEFVAPFKRLNNKLSSSISPSPSLKPPPPKSQPPSPQMAPKPQPLSPPLAPKPQPPSLSVAPKPQPSSPSVAPKPQPPSPSQAPKPQPPAPSLSPKPQAPSPSVAPKPQAPSPSVAPKPQPPSPSLAPKPQPAAPSLAPKPQPPSPSAAPKPQPPSPSVAPKPQPPSPTAAPKPPPPRISPSPAPTSLPANWDWRTFGAVTPARERFNCTASYSHAIADAVESITKISTGKLIVLSAREIGDCSNPEFSCGNGFMEVAYWFVVESGLTSEEKYPNIGSQYEYCKRNLIQPPVTRISGYKRVEENEAALQKAVFSQPVSTYMSLSPEVQHYKSGIFSGPCSNNSYEAYNAVTIVGYGVDASSKKFWIVKNSWGTKWGENGYIRIEKDTNNKYGVCAIATGGIYPVA